MKKLLGIVVLGFVLFNYNVAVSQSSLPECEGNNKNISKYTKKHFNMMKEWTNCHGTALGPGGQKYIGEFYKGKFHGQGIFTHEGREYVGQYKNHKRHGQGTYTYANGDQYIGEWKKHTYYGKGTYIYSNGDKYIGKWKKDKYFEPAKRSEQHGQGTLTKADGTIENGIWKKGKLVKRNEIGIQVAKKEPTQTQQVAKKQECIEGNCRNGQGTYTFANGDKYVGEFKNSELHGQGTYTWPDGDKYVGERKNGKIHGHGIYTRTDGRQYVGEYKDDKMHGQGTYTHADGAKYVGEFKDDKRHGQGTHTYADGRIDNGVWKKNKLVKRNEIGISVAAEPEVVEPTTTSEDTEPPIIEIAEQITVDDSQYSIEGKVSDEGSDKIYVKVDGRDVAVKKGKFKINRYSPVDEEITIVAIDKWGNKSTKVVKVKVEIKETVVVRAYPKLNPSKINGYKNNDSVAIIIGIEKYKNQFECIYCNRDASFFREYATKALGVKSSNIKLLVDSKASRGETLEAFKLWLPRIAGEGGKDIYIFFSGHGLASYDGSDLYILPQDGNSKLLEDTAISRVELISLIQKVNPKSVTMFFDTCYSGQTRNERMLIASLKPILIVADEQERPDNFTIFSASNFDQVSGSIEEAQQGMFSYYLMKGLEGKADGNKDKQITNGELIAYLKTNVSKEAFTQNREQDPMLTGDPDKVLMRYR